MWHANQIHLPFPIFIADGEVRNPLSQILKNKSLFPNISYEYHEYNDSSYLEFYKKFADAVKKIPTRYFKVTDNDDFVCASGLLKDIEFLKNNPEYICSQGIIAGFDIQSKNQQLTGSLNKLNVFYNKHYVSRNIDQGTKEERVLSLTAKYHPVYYAVYDKNKLQTILDELVALNFKDLQVHEHYWAYRVASLAKIASVAKAPIYIRQYQTSSHAPVDFAHRLVNESLIDDMRTMFKVVAEKMFAGDTSAKQIFVDKMKNAFVVFFRSWIFDNYRNRNDQLFKFGLFVKKILSYSKRPCFRSRYLAGLKRAGCNAETINNHKKELVEIERTLNSKEFIRFVQQHAPEYLDNI